MLATSTLNSENMQITPGIRQERGGLTRLLFLLCVFAVFAGQVCAGAIKLAWDPNPDRSIVGYNIYRSMTPGQYTLPPLNSAPIRTTHFADETVEVEKVYYYTVRSVTASGLESANSSELKVTTGMYDPSSPSIALLVRVFPSATVCSGQLVLLSGSAWGPAQGPMIYSWTQIIDPSVQVPTVTIVGADRSDASFVASPVSSEVRLVFRLIATDGTGVGVTGTATITVRPR